MPNPETNHLFCFGLGYSAACLAARLAMAGWTISGTSRSEGQAEKLRHLGYKMYVFDGREPRPGDWFNNVTHIVNSVPPGKESISGFDPVLSHFADIISQLPMLRWLGYLSTTGVYGNTDGAWVDETSPLLPSAPRSARRVEVEEAWDNFAGAHNLPFHIFRLAGIYGPGRNVLNAALAGRAPRIVKTGHQFSRIHVEDIAKILEASMQKPNPGAIYNVCDDEPAAAADVTSYAYKLLGVRPTPEVFFEEAEASMSDMGRSFWKDNRRVHNDKIKKELEVQLTYPTYRDGLNAIYKSDFST